MFKGRTMNEQNPYGPQPQRSTQANSYSPVPQQPGAWQSGLNSQGPNRPVPPAMTPPPLKSNGGHWWSGRLAIGIGAGLLGLVVGAASSAGNTPAATAADPVPAVTVTAPAEPAPTVTVTADPKPAPATTTEPQEVEPAKPAPKPAKAKTPSSRDWAKVVKNPDKFTGKRYVIYGEVNQFDSATGDDTFLADTAHRNTTSYGYFDGENTMLTGSAAALEDLVEGDVFRATVVVSGSFSYDTQIGGNTTVPLLQIDKIKVIGQN